MSLVEADARIAELVQLDVLDYDDTGSLRLNASFIATCRQLFEADGSCLDFVFQDEIIARAQARGVLLTNVDDLALAALEVATRATEIV